MRLDSAYPHKLVTLDATRFFEAQIMIAWVVQSCQQLPQSFFS